MTIFVMYQLSQIRRQAIKGLPDLCKDTPEHLPRIADVLTQLLQSGTYVYVVTRLKVIFSFSSTSCS